jgi:hypothetical protein
MMDRTGAPSRFPSCFFARALAQQNRRYRRQFLYLVMNGEAFASDLNDDRRGRGFYRWLWKLQYFVLEVLHGNTHASGSRQYASYLSPRILIVARS